MSEKRNITRRQILDMLERQDYRCKLSGVKLTPKTASLDHRIPIAEGGEHAIENIQIVDWRINRMKGAIGNDEFIELCRLVASQADEADCGHPLRPHPVGSR